MQNVSPLVWLGNPGRLAECGPSRAPELSRYGLLDTESPAVRVRSPISYLSTAVKVRSPSNSRVHLSRYLFPEILSTVAVKGTGFLFILRIQLSRYVFLVILRVQLNRDSLLVILRVQI